MSRRSASFDATKRYSIEESPHARRCVLRADERWIQLHGNVPSRLAGELASVYEALGLHPFLGPASSRRGRRRLRLSVSYYVEYRVHPRKRVVAILAVLHESELYR